MSAYSIRNKLVLTLLCSSLITPVGLLIYIVLIGNQTQVAKEHRVIQEHQQESVAFFENSLRHTYADILFVSKIVQHTLANEGISDKTHRNIDYTFKQFLDINPLYQQIRLIDEKGQERIRFNRQQQSIRKTADNKLQNKSAHDYLSETLTLNLGEIYISELDLNRENGAIEFPYNPTIRIATKLEEPLSKFKGIIVINISAQLMLDKINQQAHQHTFLIDHTGNYIIHPQKDKQWSAALATQQNLMKDFPKLGPWQEKLKHNKHVIFQTASSQLQASIINSNGKMQRQWFLITEIPNINIWAIIQQEHILITLACIGIFISFLLGFRFSNKWIINPIHYLESLSQQLLDGLPVDLTNPFKQQDEMSLLCQKLSQMAHIISSAREDKERYIQSLTDEINNRKKLEQALHAYQALFEHSSEAMMITDNHENITHINPAFTQITGYSEQDVIGQTPRITSSGKQGRLFYKKLWRQLSMEGYWQGEVTNKRKNGELFSVKQSINAVKIHNTLTYYISVFSDITKHKEFEETLWQQANYDSLTGLANKKLLQERINQAIAISQRHKQHAALLFMDLDNFKHINDSLGHDLGDYLLKEVATRLREGFREIDTISRFGGDEFAILITDLSTDIITAVHQIECIIKKLLSTLEKPYSIEQHELYVSSSIGISMISIEENHSPEELIKMADIAMYSSKSEGKNTYRFFHADMQARAHQRLQIESGLREAIKEDQLFLVYQCQYTADKELLGMEALIRWKHPERGLIFPNDFIPIAEESGLIIAMGEIIIKQACLQIKQWESVGQTIPHVSINVSPKQFAHPGFVETVSSICKQAGVPPEQLVLELTEATIIHDIEKTIDKMSQLQKLGHQISIDDFGTGYSSLSYLKRLPINQLKIDKAFVDDITIDNEKAVIVDTIIAMAQHLKLDLIAEGVENQCQLDYLKHRNCMGYQGYHFCKPVIADQVFTHLQAKIA